MRMLAWHPGQVKRMCTDPAYAALRVHQGKVIGPADWPAILAEKTYAECRALLLDDRRKSVRDLSLKYLLSGTAKCGECGSKMRVVKNRGYHSYACFGSGVGSGPRFCTAVRTVKLEAFIEELVFERLERPDFVAAMAARVRAQQGQATAVEDEVGTLQARLDGFYAEAATGAITPGGLAAIESRLLTEIEAARGRATTGRVSPLLRKVAGPDIRKRWPKLELGTRRMVVEELMTIRVNKTVRGSRFNPERVDIKWVTV